jgi:hypothetical protein
MDNQTGFSPETVRILIGMTEETNRLSACGGSPDFARSNIWRCNALCSNSDAVSNNNAAARLIFRASSIKLKAISIIYSFAKIEFRGRRALLQNERA